MKRVWQALTVLGALVAVGTIGYHTLEDMTILDALYMTVTTISTVGFGEVHPLSYRGRIFTIGLILFGVSAMAWAAECMVAALLEDHIHHAWWRRRMERVIDRLSNHYIVCGFGRMGAQIGRELTRRELAFVVIERDPVVLEMLRANGVLHIEGDATSDSILLTAGVAHARGLATALSGDADNALVVISAKGLNPYLQVVARASSREMEEKLLRAGADRVVTPYTIGGQRMALGLLQPAVNEFLSSVVFDAEKHTELGEMKVRENSELVGRTLRESRLRERWGAIVVAIKHQEGEFILSPSADTVLGCGDMLILVASASCWQELQHI
ncbi:MAG TPA: NAD-binding protein [Ktedonobacteraceae bacterium]